MKLNYISDPEKLAIFKSAQDNLPTILLYQAIFGMTKKEAKKTYRKLEKEIISKSAFVIREKAIRASRGK